MLLAMKRVILKALTRNSKPYQIEDLKKRSTHTYSSSTPFITWTKLMTYFHVMGVLNISISVTMSYILEILKQTYYMHCLCM